MRAREGHQATTTATADSNTLERTFQFIAIMIMIHIDSNNRMGSFRMIDRDIETHRKEPRY